MKNKQLVSFNMYEMEYQGNLIKSNLNLVQFEEKYYEQYKNLINSCFYPMRKELNIQPYEKYCDDLEEIMKQRKNIFLFLKDDELVGSVSCAGNEISSLAVNIKYQGLNYGYKIMEFAISYLQKNGVSPIKLTVTKWNKNAIALYKKLNFRILKETIVTGVSIKDANNEWRFEFIATDGLNIK